jgi:hypothetical protein
MYEIIYTDKVEKIKEKITNLDINKILGTEEWELHSLSGCHFYIYNKNSKDKKKNKKADDILHIGEVFGKVIYINNINDYEYIEEKEKKIKE